MRTTRQVSFPAVDLERIAWERYRADHPKIRQRMEILWLRHLNYPLSEIARIADCAENTVRAALDAYLQGGLTAVRAFEMPQQQRKSSLDPFRDKIIAEFVNTPPHSALEAQERIQSMTGIELTSEAVRAFLHELNFRPIKTGAYPGKANSQEQDDFKKKGSTHVWKRQIRENAEFSSSTPRTSSSEPT